MFPADNPWNRDISGDPVDPNSGAMVSSCGAGAAVHPDFGTVYDGAPNGIPYIVVHSGQARVPVSFGYADESDPGPYPIPPDAPIEGGPSLERRPPRDHRRCGCLEAVRAFRRASVGHRVDGRLGRRVRSFVERSQTGRLDVRRRRGSTDLSRLGALRRGRRGSDCARAAHDVPHFTKGYVAPARHFASSNTSASVAPMGARFRLKASVDISSYPASVQVILRAMKKYGLFLADNGSPFYVSGAPDSRWSDDDLHTLSRLHGSDFEIVTLGAVTTQ